MSYKLANEYASLLLTLIIIFKLLPKEITFFFFLITKRTYMIKCNPSSPYIVPSSKICQPSKNKRYVSSLCLELAPPYAQNA